MIAALVPSAVLFARHGQAARKMKIPFGPFLALGGRRRPLRRGPHPRRLPGVLLYDGELVVSARSIRGCAPSRRATSDGTSTDTDADRRRRRRARASSSPSSSATAGCSRPRSSRPSGRVAAARSRGAARRGLRELARRRAHLAEQYHLPLVDLAVEGVDADASQADPAARARARLRDPVRVRRRAAADRDHRSAERAGARRAPARDAAPDRVLRRRRARTC